MGNIFREHAKKIYHKIFVYGLNRHFSHPKHSNSISADGEIRLNIGAGPTFKLNNWKNADITTDAYYSGKQTDHIEFDIRSESKLPFKDETVCDVYTSHVIEHVENRYTKTMFQEVHRILKKNGVFRIACPNVDLFYYSIDMNVDPNRWRGSWFRAKGLPRPSKMNLLIREIATGFAVKSFEQDVLTDLNAKYKEMSKHEFLDYICDKVSFSYDTPGNHINWYDYHKLENMLMDAGFRIVIPSSFGASISEEMRVMPHFDLTEPQMSLYVEAVK